MFEQAPARQALFGAQAEDDQSGAAEQKGEVAGDFGAGKAQADSEYGGHGQTGDLGRGRIGQLSVEVQQADPGAGAEGQQRHVGVKAEHGGLRLGDQSVEGEAGKGQGQQCDAAPGREEGQHGEGEVEENLVIERPAQAEQRAEAAAGRLMRHEEQRQQEVGQGEDRALEEAWSDQGQRGGQTGEAPVERHDADGAAAKEGDRVEVGAARYGHHDEAADDEEQRHAQLAQLRQKRRCLGQWMIGGVGEDDQQSGQATQILYGHQFHRRASRRRNAW